MAEQACPPALHTWQQSSGPGSSGMTGILSLDAIQSGLTMLAIDPENRQPGDKARCQWGQQIRVQRTCGGSKRPRFARRCIEGTASVWGGAGLHHLVPKAGHPLLLKPMNFLVMPFLHDAKNSSVHCPNRANIKQGASHVSGLWSPAYMHPPDGARCRPLPNQSTKPAAAPLHHTRAQTPASKQHPATSHVVSPRVVMGRRHPPNGLHRRCNPHARSHHQRSKRGGGSAATPQGINQSQRAGKRTLPPLPITATSFRHCSR